jgi:hypothetical protein
MENAPFSHWLGPRAVQEEMGKRNIFFFGFCLGFAHSVRGEFTDDVSETAVGFISGIKIPIHEE